MCLCNRAKSICVCSALLCWCKCLFSLAHSAEDMSGCVFWSSEPSGVDVCFFLRTVWTVSHSCQTHPRMNGRLSSHSLNQPPVACACVDVCQRVFVCQHVEVGGRSSIHSNCHLSLSLKPHMSCYLSKNDERTLPASPPCAIQRLILFYYRCLMVLQIYFCSMFNLKRRLRKNLSVKATVWSHF